MSEPRLVDVTGRLRSPAPTPGHSAGCTLANKGRRCPADPPTVEETILVMRQARAGPYADRTRALIALLWRVGLRISEALALTESDLRRRPGMCSFARVTAKSGGSSGWTTARGNTSLLGPSTGRGCRSDRCSASSPGRPADAAGQSPPCVVSCAGVRPTRGVRRRFAPQQPQASPCDRDGTRGIPQPIIQRRSGIRHLGITSIYLHGTDTREIVDTLHHRRPPVIPASAGLRPSPRSNRRLPSGASRPATARTPPSREAVTSSRGGQTTLSRLQKSRCLRGSGRFRRSANVLWVAVRAAEARVIRPVTWAASPPDLCATTPRHSQCSHATASVMSR